MILITNNTIIASHFINKRELAEVIAEDASLQFVSQIVEKDEDELQELRDDEMLEDEVYDELCGFDDEDLTRIAALVTNNFHTALVAGEPVGRIGNLYSANYLSFMSDDHKRTENAWYPQFEFNRTLVMIADETDKRGLKNFKNKEDALAYAKEALLKQQEMERNESRTSEQEGTGDSLS